MKKLSGTRALTLLVAGLISVPAVIAQEPATHGEGRYIVKFRAFGDAALAADSSGRRTVRMLERHRSAAMILSDAELRRLRSDPNVEYVEIDQRRYPMGQGTPYGIGMVQADDAALTVSNASAGSTVCIIDSGYYRAHEDLQDSNVAGSIDPGTGNWFDDSCGHGSHVAGTISALDNAVGVVGVNRNGLLQMHIEKVFDGASCAWTYSSDLIAALDRCQDAIAGTSQKLVVNMSLAGSGPSVAEDAAFQAAYDAGVLSIAAAGNAGSTAVTYPAGYASVVSVAAVDSTGTAASFSQRNADVELAAPGVGVVSTTPFNVSRLVSGDDAWLGSNMTGSARVDATGLLADGGLCDSVGSWNGNVVVCRRGTITFAQKVSNVTSGGGVGVAIYNNVAGSFTGTVGGPTAIPAISLSLADGQAALTHAGSESSLINSGGFGNGYQPYDGTSMATPHVSGIAALLWSLYPSKSNAEIREALQKSALDKGAAGRDNTYGFGIVQAKVAYDYLAGIIPPPPPPPATITLTVAKVRSDGMRYAKLRWTGATGASVNYFRNTMKFKTANDGVKRDGPLALGTYAYKVCNLNSTTCSDPVTITY